MEIAIILLGIMMLAGALSVLFQKSLKNAIITFGIVNFIAALMFTLMKAYDVAIAEASIGTLLTIALFFWALRRLEEDGYHEKK